MNKGSCRNPRIFPNLNGGGPKRESILLIVVTASAKIGLLRNRDAISQHDLALRIELNSVRNPDRIAQLEIPRGPNPNVRIYMDT
jgi:hypothetical protein